MNNSKLSKNQQKVMGIIRCVVESTGDNYVGLHTAHKATLDNLVARGLIEKIEFKKYFYRLVQD